MPETQTIPTLAEINTEMERAWKSVEAVLPKIAPALENGPTKDDGWTTRELLSHVVGSWQRVPLHAAYFLEGAPLPIQIDNCFWTPEWQTAPLSAFQLSIQAAYEGNKAFLGRLTEADLRKESDLPFGKFSLGTFLMLTYDHHLLAHHQPQLEALAEGAGLK